MKKLLVLIACVFLFAGCSDASAKVTNGTEAVVTVDGEAYTREDLYNFMSNYGGAYYAVSNAQKIILDTEIPVTDEMKANVDATLDTYSTMMGDYFETYLQSQGFSGLDQYREILLQNEQLTQLYVNYVEVNYESLASKYTPRQVQIMQFDNEDTAKEALEAVKAGTEFVNVAQEKQSKIDGSAQIVTSINSFETAVQYKMSVMANDELSDVFANDGNTAFYIIKMISNDVNAIKDDAVQSIAKIEAIADESIQYYFEEYNFTVYDINLFNQLQQNYADLLNQ